MSGVTAALPAVRVEDGCPARVVAGGHAWACPVDDVGWGTPRWIGSCSWRGGGSQSQLMSLRFSRGARVAAASGTSSLSPLWRGGGEADVGAFLDFVEGDLEDAELGEVEGFELVQVLCEEERVGLDFSSLGVGDDFPELAGGL